MFFSVQTVQTAQTVQSVQTVQRIRKNGWVFTSLMFLLHMSHQETGLLPLFSERISSIGSIWIFVVFIQLKTSLWFTYVTYMYVNDCKHHLKLHMFNLIGM